MKLHNSLFTFILALILIIGSAGAQDNTSTSMDATETSLPVFFSTVISSSPTLEENSKENIQSTIIKTSSLDVQKASETIIPGIEWQKLLGGTYGEGICDLQQISDGGYIGVGAIGSYYMNNIPTGCRGLL